VTDPAYIDTLPTGESSPWWLSTDCAVVHREACGHARHPWLWAVGLDERHVRELVTTLNTMRLCRVCLPESKGKR
jgi:hypothetical protein